MSACAIGAAPRPVTEKIRIDSNVVVPMRDGIKLYADVYRPARPGKFPVAGGAHSIRQAARRHSRGQGRIRPARVRRGGPGCARALRIRRRVGPVPQRGAGRLRHRRVGCPAAVVERQGGDGRRIVPRQRAVAGGRASPPSLAAIFPAVASTSLYHNTFYHGGAFKLAVSYGWGAVRMPLRIMYPQYWHTEPMRRWN